MSEPIVAEGVGFVARSKAGNEKGAFLGGAPERVQVIDNSLRTVDRAGLGCTPILNVGPWQRIEPLRRPS